MKTIENILQQMNGISLEEMAHVKLMNRFDSKYLVNAEMLPVLLNQSHERYNVLTINDNKTLLYNSLYFDTNDFACYLDHHNGKTKRYKIRFRHYEDSGDTFLEVKKKFKGKTFKTRLRTDSVETSLKGATGKFIKKNTPFESPLLEPKQTNTFKRISMAHKILPERITIDYNVEFAAGGNSSALPYLGIIEVKQEHPGWESDFIKILKNLQLHRSSFSKYCIGTALLNKDIKHNRFKKEILEINRLKSNNETYNTAFFADQLN